MFDFDKFKQNTISLESQVEFSQYLQSISIELEEYFSSLTINELNKIKFNLEDFLYSLISLKLVNKKNLKSINSFLLLIAEQIERANLIGAISVVLDYLPDTSVKNRLLASKLYIKVNNISIDYHNRFNKIIELIVNSDYEDMDKNKSINSILSFYLKAAKSFTSVNNFSLLESFKQLFIDNQTTYPILKEIQITSIVNKLSITNYDSIVNEIENNKINRTICLPTEDQVDIKIENSQYSKKLYNLDNPTFNSIRQVSFDFIKSIGDPVELHTALNQGVTIINDENLLYKYIVSYGTMHKAKLYEAFDELISRLNNNTINIIDWGCGQALATSLLIEYIQEKNLQIDIEDIILIEPSELALIRGLLHLDILKHQDYNIKSINKNLDCLNQNDITFDNDNVVLHLFSNILDVELFKLDTIFLEKISANIQNDNYFICVSPNINAKRNNRIDTFYRYFNENYNTDLISTRDTDISSYKRYEKIFYVKYTKLTEVIEVRDEMIQVSNEINDYHVNIYEKLENYISIVEPIIDTKRLKENIEIDPDYVIFKIRKVTEIITSKIYAKYEDNESKVSQNDKIRYLSFEKKVLSRKAQSHLHTIRTIGNISAHEHIENPIKLLKDDAYFLTTALVLLIEDLININILKIN